jgi:hypothetical protein
MESSGATPEAPKPPPEVESAVLLGHIDEETARKLVAQLAEEI